MRHAAAAFLLAVSLLVSPAHSAAPEKGRADTVLFNGKIFTADPDRPWAQAVAVKGRFIVAVGSDQEVLSLAKGKTKKIDLQGRTVIPGLNDAHVHSFWTSRFPRAVHVNSSGFVPGPGPVLSELLSSVAAGAAANPPGTWLFATVGTNISDDPAADRFAIDAVSPDHPVLAFVWSGHGTYFNTRAMELLGLSATQPDPPHGLYERVHGTNVLKGIAHEYAESLMARYFAQRMTDQEFIDVFRAFSNDAVRKGYTSIQDMAIGLPQSRTMDLLDRADPAVRWRSICFPLEVGEACDGRMKYSPNRPFSKLVASGVKWITDGTPVERLGHVTVDYRDRPGWFGRSNFAEPEYGTILARALSGRARKAQTLLHITGDANWDQVFDTMSSLAPDHAWRKRRLRVEHGDLLRPDQFGEARRKGVTVVQNPTHFGIVDIFSQRFHPHVLEDAMPWKSLLNEGVHIAIGSDGIGSAGNPYLDIFLAAIHPIRPSEAVSVQEAVVAYTAGSARAEFAERWKGTLTPGKLADLAVLSGDIFTLPLPAILGTGSVLTMVDGKVVYQAM